MNKKEVLEQNLPPENSKLNGAQSLYRTLAILKVVADHNERGMRMSKIAEVVGLPTTTAHRILSVLVQEGFVEYDIGSKHYHLGIELFSLGMKAHKFLIRDKYRGVLEHVSKSTQETAYLVARSGNDSLCIDRVLGSFPIQVLTFEIGQRRPLGIGAGSVAILASLPQDELERIIADNAERYRVYRGRTPEDIWESVKNAQKKGYGMSIKNVTEDTIGVGVPIHDSSGSVTSAISVAGIERRMQPDQITKIVALIRATLKDGTR